MPTIVAANRATHPRMIAAVEKRTQVVHLRRQGISFRVIAAQLGISVDGAYHAFHAAMAERSADPVEVAELRELENERLDAMLAGVWRKAVSGDTTAIYAAVRISERRSKLWGLDAPVKTQIEDVGPGGKLPLAFIDEIVAEYEKMRATSATVIIQDDPSATVIIQDE